MTYLLLFFEFFQTGLFAVGGGLVMLPFIQQMIERYPEWFGTLQLADIVAIAESTPGPIGINAATFAGFSAAGVLGALTATLSVVLPSFIVVSLIAPVLAKYRQNRLVNDAFTGLHPAVTGLIAAACWIVLRIAVLRGSVADGFFQAIDWRCAALFAVLFACTQIKKIKTLHPVVFILLGGLAGVVLGL